MLSENLEKHWGGGAVSHDYVNSGSSVVLASELSAVIMLHSRI